MHAPRNSCLKMNSCAGLILILLGLFLKASSEEISTNAYYLELHIEAAAYENFTELLKKLNLNVSQDQNTATVQNISITTECNSTSSGQVNCSCNENYTWSDEVCKNYTQCCTNDQNNKLCTFKTPNPRAMCLHKNTVLVNGSFTVLDEPYVRYFDDPASKQYQDFVKNYTEKLETIYSRLTWFDTLKITKLRQGSVIGEFWMMITSPEIFVSKDLENATLTLQYTSNATFDLNVTGFVKMTMNPAFQKTLKYGVSLNITCTTPENLGKPEWLFQQNASNPKQITSGLESTVTNSDCSSTVYIKATTEVWKGTYKCSYTKSNIRYIASQYLDIALLPRIFSTSDPQFPDCTQSQKRFQIKVQCIVPDAGEDYQIDWNDNGNSMNGKSITKEQPALLGNGLISYQAYKIIYCDENKENTSATCTFKNRNNQTANATININIIYATTKVCPKNSEWATAKAGFTAEKLCDFGSVGLKTRNCLSNGQWDNVTSMCVTRDLSDLLNDAKDLQRGLGIVKENAYNIFDRLRISTEQQTVNSFANVNASVDVLATITNASKIQDSQWDAKVLSVIAKSTSNLLNGSLNDSWKSYNVNESLASTYLKAIEDVINQTYLPTGHTDNDLIQENVQITIYKGSDANSTSINSFKVNATCQSNSPTVQTAIKNLASKLPNNLNKQETDPSDIILSVIADNCNKIKLELRKDRLPNHEMYCVFWNFNTSQWSDEGCKWGGVDNPNICECQHLSAFTILMAKEPIKLLYNEELTYAGLGLSIGSLTLCLVIEFLVWNAVVKSNIAHFRHTVLVNIMVSLLIADCSFLASPTPSSNPSNWCLSLTVMKHFCYLAVFFWMMCLGLGLLHQVIFVFVHLRKKVYLGLCFFLGYVCPLLIVVVTFISHNNGATGSYYSTETCWLMYKGVLKGSIYAFLLPVFVIVFVNMFTMAIVISRILKPTLSEGSSHDEKEVARSIVKTVVLLTPTLGITWILGLFMQMLDLTKQPYAQIVNYAFTFFNSFQGFFILLTGCFGEKRVRDALLKRLRSQQSVNYKSESSTRMTSITKQK
ncbi:adhesion G-protein coupled receptor F3 [Astyanax mexicanus]|uniref:adhesion G-protein coupled receptor F3 n=1 Tax=Astyanax mexicanus TaxID=7994 RepID=UPI0020CB1B95|nr:adhesion G-protein coupled receptor F3 [Astyanax mexicanus]